MRKLLLISTLLVACLASFAGTAPALHNNHHARVFKRETYVYICNSSGAYAYHSSKTCKGLNRCTHEILKVTLNDAVKIYHRKPCKICE